MPDPDPTPEAPLEWNEMNLCRVLSEICTRALHDEAFHKRVMKSPLAVLKPMIKVPAEYESHVFAKPKNMPALIFSVPLYDADAAPAASQAAAAEGNEYKVQADYVLYCTIIPW
jgi:hypothetical protein